MSSRRTKPRSRRRADIVCCGVLIGILVAQTQPSLGRPGDIISTTSSPGVGAPAQEKRGIDPADTSYASRTGAFEYQYQFAVPPGRLGMQPSIDLAYSSQGALRGGIASNWSMGFPMIQKERSENHALVHGVGPFVSSLSGGHRLQRVSESVEAGWDAYRAEYDDQYIRYEKHRQKRIWRAKTLDGKTWYFRYWA